MKAAYLKEPMNISIKEIEQRPLKPGEALIQIKSAGICGSDLGALRGTNNLVRYPVVIGHELAGTLLSVPEDNKKGLKVGDRVIVDPYLYCGHCYPCSIGRTNCCNDLKVLGVHIDGGMAETFAHPADFLLKAPDDIDWDILPIAEPLVIALHGLHRVGLKAGEHLAIFGAGTIGMLMGMGALAYGAVPILIDLVEERLNFAHTLGIQNTINLKTDDLMEKILEFTDGRLCECVLEASGANAAIRSSLDIVCHAGRVGFTGWPKKETPIPTDMITRKEIDIRGARTAAGEFEESIELIRSGKVDARKILTKVITIDEVPETIMDIEKNPGNYLKVNVMF